MTFELALICLLIGSNAFWAFQCQKLINKLMSRSYHEYEQAHLKVEPKAPTIKVPSDETEDFGALHEVINR